ncbi:hypothetical protein TNCV_854741 [Trichonephila clavipes]|nr:hypothetical protein TNCV_854741 [Trichonephila clavipes]
MSPKFVIGDDLSSYEEDDHKRTCSQRPPILQRLFRTIRLRHRSCCYRFLRKFPEASIWSPSRQTCLPKILPTWLYRQYFTLFPFKTSL